MCLLIEWILTTMTRIVIESIKGIHLYAVHNKHAYNFSYAYPTDREVGSFKYINSYLPTAEQIVKSLKIIDQVQYSKDDLTHYPKNESSFLYFEYPNVWNITRTGTGIQINPNDYKDPYTYIAVRISSAENSKLEDIVGDDVNSFKNNQNYVNFKLVESNGTILFNNPAQNIVTTFIDNNTDTGGCQCETKAMSIYTIIDSKVYIITYQTEQDRYYNYLPTFINIIASMNVHKTASVNHIHTSGIRLNGSPVDLAVNPITNKIYVAIPQSRQIQVINGATDHVMSNISIGANPNSVAVDPVTNKVYVASPETDMVYIIDGINNTIIHRVKVGPLVGDLTVDTHEFGGFGNLVFVANQGSKIVNVIDPVQGKILANISTSNEPISIAIDQLKNRAYVTSGDHTVDVIDYATESFGRKFRSAYYGLIELGTGNFPFGIVVDPIAGKGYIANSESTNITVIDTITNKEIDSIPGGLFPTSLAFNPINKKLYVTNTGNNAILIVNTKNNHHSINSSNEVATDSVPLDIAVNPKTGMVYVANHDSKSISTINGNTDKLVSGITFHINPPEAGYIECNGKTMLKDTYIHLYYGTLCKAIANTGFVF